MPFRHVGKNKTTRLGGGGGSGWDIILQRELVVSKLRQKCRQLRLSLFSCSFFQVPDVRLGFNNAALAVQERAGHIVAFGVPYRDGVILGLSSGHPITQCCSLRAWVF